MRNFMGLFAPWECYGEVIVINNIVDSAVEKVRTVFRFERSLILDRVDFVLNILLLYRYFN